jgi:hypothetical protein
MTTQWLFWKIFLACFIIIFGMSLIKILAYAVIFIAVSILFICIWGIIKIVRGIKRIFV